MFIIYDLNLLNEFLYQITYEAVGVVQMTFLRLLSSYAYQNFTYTCVQSRAWFDQDSLSHDKAIRLIGQEEHIFSIDANKPDVLSDGCAVSKYVKFHDISAICKYSIYFTAR